MKMLDFKLEDSTDSPLQKIFKGTDFNKYKWYILDEQAYYMINGEEKSSLFSRALGEYTITGKQFHEGIKREEYYLIFMVIFAFPIQSDIPKLVKLNDVVMSDCEFAFMLYDCVEGVVYSKNYEVLETIYKNCKENSINARYKNYSIETMNKFMV